MTDIPAPSDQGPLLLPSEVRYDVPVEPIVSSEIAVMSDGAEYIIVVGVRGARVAVRRDQWLQVKSDIEALIAGFDGEKASRDDHTEQTRRRPLAMRCKRHPLKGSRCGNSAERFVAFRSDEAPEFGFMTIVCGGCRDALVEVVTRDAVHPLVVATDLSVNDPMVRSAVQRVDQSKRFAIRVNWGRDGETGQTRRGGIK